MSGVIDMQLMRYLNLFERVTRIQTRYCFKYNETIFFCVPRKLVSKAVGENGRNVKKLNEILNKKIKVIAWPEDDTKIKEFIQSIIGPVIFKNLEVTDDEVKISASMQSKAALIGRNKRRLLEMQQIIRDYFRREFRVV